MKTSREKFEHLFKNIFVLLFLFAIICLIAILIVSEIISDLFAIILYFTIILIFKFNKKLHFIQNIKIQNSIICLLTVLLVYDICLLFLPLPNFVSDQPNYSMNYNYVFGSEIIIEENCHISETKNLFKEETLTIQPIVANRESDIERFIVSKQKKSFALPFLAKLYYHHTILKFNKDQSYTAKSVSDNEFDEAIIYSSGDDNQIMVVLYQNTVYKIESSKFFDFKLIVSDFKNWCITQNTSKA